MYQTSAQKGISLYGWIIIILLVIFFSLVTIKLVPVYIEHNNIKDSFTSLKDVPNLVRKTPEEVKTLFTRRLEMNNVRRVTSDDLKVTRVGGGTRMTLELQYVAQVPFIANIDLLIKFDEKEEIGQ